MNVDLPPNLHAKLRELVDQGWYASEGDIVRDAIRRFLEARVPDLMARFVREDAEWGLEGDD